MSPLRCTRKATRKLATGLTRRGYRIGTDTVGDLLREEDFSLIQAVVTLHLTCSR